MAHGNVILLLCLGAASPPSPDCSWRAAQYDEHASCFDNAQAAVEALRGEFPGGVPVRSGACWRGSGQVFWVAGPSKEPLAECHFDDWPGHSMPGWRARLPFQPFEPGCWSDADFATATGRPPDP